MMNKKLSMLALGVSMLLMVSACGTEAKQSAEPAPPEVTQTEAVKPEPKPEPLEDIAPMEDSEPVVEVEPAGEPTGEIAESDGSTDEENYAEIDRMLAEAAASLDGYDEEREGIDVVLGVTDEDLQANQDTSGEDSYDEGRDYVEDPSVLVDNPNNPFSNPFNPREGLTEEEIQQEIEDSYNTEFRVHGTVDNNNGGEAGGKEFIESGGGGIGSIIDGTFEEGEGGVQHNPDA